MHIEVQDYVSDAHKELVCALQNPIRAVAQRECVFCFVFLWILATCWVSEINLPLKIYT